MDENFLPKILIVDDDKTTLHLLKAILNNYGDVLTATNGQDALNLIQHSMPDIVLLDIEMPVMNGFDTCIAIKQNKDYNDLPILFITSHIDHENEEKALELGAVDFIPKPIRAAVVKARVLTHLTLKLKTDELKRMTLLDPLTKLYNRRALKESLDQEWRRACRVKTALSLLMIDIDFFKLYNDTYGHQAGDDALMEVAGALKKIFRRAGDLVVRYGGEEFIVLLPQTDVSRAIELANLVREQIAGALIPHDNSDTSDVLTVSIGVGAVSHLIQGEKRKMEDLIEVADKALYEAKMRGRNQTSSRILETAELREVI